MLYNMYIEYILARRNAHVKSLDMPIHLEYPPPPNYIIPPTNEYHE